MVLRMVDGTRNSSVIQKASVFTKLHGSLDWVDDEMYGICSLLFDRHPKAEDFEVNKLPLLIFGTDAKLSGKDPFLTLVHAFSEHLRLADVLVAIGYSFTDVYINEIVEQRMRDNLSLKLIVVGPRTDEIKNSRAFLDNNHALSPSNRRHSMRLITESSGTQW